MIVLMFLNIPLFAAIRAGTVLDVAGEVSQLKNEREAKILPLKLNDDLLFNDSVMTGDASSTRLLLSPDEKRIRFYVHENSKLKIDPVLIKDGKKNFVTRFSKGLIRVITEKLEGDSVTIITPNATVGIRGTTVDILVGEEDKSIIFTNIAVGGDGRGVTVIIKGTVTPVPVEQGTAMTVTTNVATGKTTVTPIAYLISFVPDLVQVRDNRVIGYSSLILGGQAENSTAVNNSTFSRSNGGEGGITRCRCSVDSDPTCAPPASILCSTD